MPPLQKVLGRVNVINLLVANHLPTSVADPEGFHRFPLKPPLLDNVYNNYIHLQQLWTLKKLPCLVPSLFTNCS